VTVPGAVAGGIFGVGVAPILSPSQIGVTVVLCIAAGWIIGLFATMLARVDLRARYEW
jgi:hypothetical protein